MSPSAARVPCALPCFIGSSAECQQNKRHVRNRLNSLPLAWKPPPCDSDAVAEAGERVWTGGGVSNWNWAAVRRSFENPGNADRVGLFELGQHASSLELNIEENGSRKPSAPLRSGCVGQQGIQSDTQTHSHTHSHSYIHTVTHRQHTQNNTHPRTHTHALAYIRLT